jgi:hypothetical protein
MTSKEKAQYLFDIYTNYVGEYNVNKHAKQCAIIAVDELISSHNKYDDNAQSNSEEYYFYSEVKKEIESL